LGEARHIGDDFVSIVTHELRTPLTAVQGGAAVLLQHWRELPPETVEELLASIDRQANRMNALVSNLLELSRLDRGTLRIEVLPVPLREIVDAAVHAASTNGAAVEVEVGDDVVVSADGLRLRRIIEELVVNAAHSGAAGVTVRADTRGDEVDVVVADDGPGVPEPIAGDVFGRFVKGATGEPTGWGLGLALVRELAEAQGGRVTYSPNEPAGSRFTVTLGACR
jgi:signal transduction histidine kinase